MAWRFVLKGKIEMIYIRFRYWICNILPIFFNVILILCKKIIFQLGLINICAYIGGIQFLILLLYPCYLIYINIYWYPPKKIFWLIILVLMEVMNYINVFVYSFIVNFKNPPDALDKLLDNTFVYIGFLIILICWPLAILMKELRNRIKEAS